MLLEGRELAQRPGREAWTHTQTRTHTHWHLPHLCPWVWGIIYLTPPSVSFFLFILLLAIFLSAGHTSGCVQCKDWLWVAMCVWAGVPVNYSLRYMCPAVAPSSLPLPLPSPALSLFPCLSVPLRHSCSGTLRAQRSGWSTWWSRWLVARRGLAWHGGSQAIATTGYPHRHHSSPTEWPISMFKSNPKSTLLLNWYTTASPLLQSTF